MGMLPLKRDRDRFGEGGPGTVPAGCSNAVRTRTMGDLRSPEGVVVLIQLNTENALAYQTDGLAISRVA